LAFWLVPPAVAPFVEQAQSVCARTDEAGRRILQPPPSASPAERIAFVEGRLRVIGGLLGDMSALTPPVDHAEQMRQLLASVRQAVDRSREQIIAAAAGDRAEVDRLQGLIISDG